MALKHGDRARRSRTHRPPARPSRLSASRVDRALRTADYRGDTTALGFPFTVAFLIAGILISLSVLVL